MKHDRSTLRSGARTLALACVVAAGLASIVGSGGGSIDAPECSFFSTSCNPVVTPPPPTPQVSISPLRTSVQAGTAVLFTAQSSGVTQPSYQWRRSADGGVNFVDIAGANAATYTLAQAQVADHGAVFRVDLLASSSSAVLASSNSAALVVSSLPAVGFADGDFDPGDWNASAIADPAQQGPTHSEERAASGGSPGAFRRMVHTMSAGPSSLRVFNLKVSASYDPRALGAIRAIDHAEDCSRLSATSNALDVSSHAMFEQAGRRYVSKSARGCLSQWVNNFAQLTSLGASDFVQVDGPACGAGESCPDFSAAGAPLRLGFERRVSLLQGAPAGSIEHGIDNWTIKVWRP